MTLVPHPATHANAPPTGGQHHAVSRQARPVIVAVPTTGVTIRLAGTDINGTAGSIRICTGSVQHCAATVRATASATIAGRNRSSRAAIAPVQVMMPNTAAQESANP